MGGAVLSGPTPADIAAAQTPAGGWTRESLAQWGVPWPPPAGWRKKLTGTSHPLQRPCPTCRAESGQACISKRGHRKSFHRARGVIRKRHKIQPVDHLRTESPIEKALAGSILGWIEHHGAQASVTTQAKIGAYRADILVEIDDRKLIVECDGAEFHGSPEQVERDKRRDRYCAARGWCVMRFTGSEIHRDPRGCAIEVGAWIMLP
jgi:very-short-patch-repair endonuclease